MNEQQRQGAFDEAVLDYDRCKLALAEVNRQLQAFPQDPTLACERLKQQLAIVEELAASARENLRAPKHASPILPPNAHIAPLRRHRSN